MFARICPALRRFALALAALLSILALAPLPALADDGLAPGTAATVTAGESTIIRTSPGFDAASAGEVAPGSQVTVLDYPVAAPDGSLWYPVAGGYLPAYALSGAAPATDPSLQQAAQPADPAAADPAATDQTWTDPTSTDPAATDQTWTDPAATDQTSTDPNTGAAVGSDTWTDPATTDPAAAPAATDPTTGQPVAAPATGDGTGTDPNAAAAPAGPNPAGAPIGTAWIAGTNGDGAICHSAADLNAPEIGVLPEGSSVDVTGGVVGEWEPVNCNGVGGYVHASFISWEQPQSSQQPAAPAADGTDATLSDPAAAPSDQTLSDPTVSQAPADGSTLGASTGPSDPQPRGGNRRHNSAGAGGGSASGQQIANFALQYVGYPYTYAGAGPYSFDCTGFTMFVIENTLGMDISHDAATQYSMGAPVGRNDLQPGDLVFFQDTFAPGLSHAGIYIGNGQFVHAENESTGVVVSDLNSDYYASHWYGAVRLV